ncbi:MAG TPA: site-2 protease family protein [Gemmatimonadaceae bacterium]|jgi:Zn-dependent protease|nr:site-2 protease family protein [Gemmatimonadaceae bacterium]
MAAPVLLFSVIAHEYAHGYAALKQGDTTALSLGRLTWNPVKHIDPFMTVILPLVLAISSKGQIILGGAKPVPVNPRNYRNFKRGDIIVSLAGVTANLVIALAAVIVFIVAGLLGRGLSGLETTLAIMQAMMVTAVRINLLLLAFNLIPIPPLDGSHVVKYLLPLRLAVWYQQVGRYGIVILVLLLSFGGTLLNTWLAPAFSFGELLLRLADPYKLPSLSLWLA